MGHLMINVVNKIRLGISFVVNSIPDILYCVCCRGCCKEITICELQAKRKAFWFLAFVALLAGVLV